MKSQKREILIKLAHSEIAGALDSLFQEMIYSGKIWEDFILQSAKYYRISEGYDNGVLKLEEWDKEMNKITQSLIKLVLKRID